MYSYLLTLHSWVRWLLLFSLLASIIVSYTGWKQKRIFSKTVDLLRHNTATIAHIQLILGLSLYFISPVVDYFLRNFEDAIHLREIRFFGMEHITVMFVAIIILSTGSLKAKRKKIDSEKFRTMFVWYLISFVLILSSIPWAFSPLISRPWFRFF